MVIGLDPEQAPVHVVEGGFRVFIGLVVELLGISVGAAGGGFGSEPVQRLVGDFFAEFADLAALLEIIHGFVADGVRHAVALHFADGILNFVFIGFIGFEIGILQLLEPGDFLDGHVGRVVAFEHPVNGFQAFVIAVECVERAFRIAFEAQ